MAKGRRVVNRKIPLHGVNGLKKIKGAALIFSSDLAGGIKHPLIFIDGFSYKPDEPIG